MPTPRALVAVLLLVPLAVVAGPPFEAAAGERRAGQAELQRRVAELEHHVYQLHLRLSQLESARASAPQPLAPWTCSVSAFGRAFVHTAASEGQARGEVLRTCTAEFNAMFCKDINCSQ